MSSSIRPDHCFSVLCSVTYNTGLFLKLWTCLLGLRRIQNLLLRYLDRIRDSIQRHDLPLHVGNRIGSR